MLRPDNLFPIFGIILLLLASIGVISFTSRFIIGLGRIKIVQMTQQIFDSDLSVNFTLVCPHAANPYQTQYNRTVCFNKTMHHWYIPWRQFDVWREFREMNEEKRRRLREEAEMIRLQQSNEMNDTKWENRTEEELPITAEDKPKDRADAEEPSKVVCTILAALLIISTVVAFCEVFRDKCVAKNRGSPGIIEKDLRFTFDDELSVDRGKHSSEPNLPRQEGIQSAAKVTQTLVHQSSLDRAFSIMSPKVKPPFLRRSSVPAHLVEGDSGIPNRMGPFSTPQPYGCTQQASPSSNESPATRRRSRHFIRRH